MTDMAPPNRPQSHEAARVYKWKLLMPNREGLAYSEPMPPLARVLSVGIQGGEMVVWARLDGDPSEHPSDPRAFIVLNTGTEVAAHRLDDGRFLGTVTSDTGIVWHIWEDDQLA